MTNSTTNHSTANLADRKDQFVNNNDHIGDKRQRKLLSSININIVERSSHPWRICIANGTISIQHMPSSCLWFVLDSNVNSKNDNEAIPVLRIRMNNNNEALHLILHLLLKIGNAIKVMQKQ